MKSNNKGITLIIVIITIVVLVIITSIIIGGFAHNSSLEKATNTREQMTDFGNQAEKDAENLYDWVKSDSFE